MNVTRWLIAVVVVAALAALPGAAAQARPHAAASATVEHGQVVLRPDGKVELRADVRHRHRGQLAGTATLTLTEGDGDVVGRVRSRATAADAKVLSHHAVLDGASPQRILGQIRNREPLRLTVSHRGTLDGTPVAATAVIMPGATMPFMLTPQPDTSELTLNVASSGEPPASCTYTTAPPTVVCSGGTVLQFGFGGVLITGTLYTLPILSGSGGGAFPAMSGWISVA